MAIFTNEDAYKKSRNLKNVGDVYDPSKKYSPYTDDDYLAEIDKYKDKDWYQQLLTNPWLAGNQARFSPNLGQQILQAFGDNQAEDKYYAELRSNRSQWLSEFLEKMRQQEYDSPVQQVAREAAAGINPDLSGNITPGAAAENDQPMLGHPSFGEPFDIKQLGSFFMDIYSLASGFAKDAVSMQSMMNHLTSEDLDINKSIVDSTNEFIKGHTALGWVEDENGDGRYSIQPPTDDMINSYASKNFRSRSARRKFINEVKSSYASGRANSIRYGSVAEGQQAKGNLARVIGHNEAYGDNDLDPMIIVEKSLSKMERDIVEMQNKYTSDYFHSASGTQAGDAVNAQNKGIVEENEARSYQRKMDSIVNRTMEQMISKLERSAREGGLEGLIAKGMLGFISAYRLQMIPSLPSVNLQGLIQNRNFTTNNNTYSE